MLAVSSFRRIDRHGCTWQPHAQKLKYVEQRLAAAAAAAAVGHSGGKWSPGKHLLFNGFSFVLSRRRVITQCVSTIVLKQTADNYGYG